MATITIEADIGTFKTTGITGKSTIEAFNGDVYVSFGSAKPADTAVGHLLQQGDIFVYTGSETAFVKGMGAKASVVATDG